MWCHLCKKLFPDPKIFSLHIMKKHRLSSKFKNDNSESEHSKLETNDSENDEIKEDNSAEEDSLYAENCSENNSLVNATTPRMNTRVKSLRYKFSSRNNRRFKIRSKLNISKSNKTISKSANKRKKHILKSISKQLTNYNFLSNHQPVLSVSCLNEPPLSTKTGFEFDSENILLWLQKFKEMYKKLTLPLNQKVFYKIMTINKEIFGNYSATQSNEVTTAVFKVYDELDWLIHRHFISIDESLSNKS